MTAQKLMEEARQAALRAYAPYSRFRVGAALLMGNGEVVTGANIENRSFGLTNCAERSAIFTAVSSGRTDIRAIAVAGPDAWEPLSPCGACRQVIGEFCPPDTPVYYEDAKGGFIETTAGELLPANPLSNFSERIGHIGHTK